MGWHPIEDVEVRTIVSAILKQLRKWGPGAMLAAGALAAFLSPSVEAAAKAHPASLGWAILLSLVTHLAPSPLKK